MLQSADVWKWRTPEKSDLKKLQVFLVWQLVLKGNICCGYHNGLKGVFANFFSLVVSMLDSYCVRLDSALLLNGHLTALYDGVPIHLSTETLAILCRFSH